jgi:hypothetical protein
VGQEFGLMFKDLGTEEKGTGEENAEDFEVIDLSGIDLLECVRQSNMC